MSVFTQFSAARAAHVQVITSGSGSYTPVIGTPCWLRVTMLGGGGGGGGGQSANTIGGGGGGGGQVIHAMVRAASAISYAVGAGGAGGAVNTAGTAGSDTTFGQFVAQGGIVQSGFSAGGEGGGWGSGTARDGLMLDSAAGGAGGSGSTPSGGRAPGYPVKDLSTFVVSTPGTDASTRKGGGGGGSSVYGRGGNGGNANNSGNATAGAAGTGYGAGGGGGGAASGTGGVGGAGTGGLIIIEEFPTKE